MTNDTKKRLHQLINRSRRRWAMFALAVILLTAWVKFIDWYFYVNFNFLFARRAFFKKVGSQVGKQVRIRAHWVGSQIARPHLLAFASLSIVLIVGTFTAPTVKQSLYWALGWGGFFSVFVTVQSLSLIQRAYVRSNQT